MEYNDNEFIKLNRKIIGWEWYLNINVKTLFIHCLLKANWKDGRFEGKEVKRGSFVTSLEKLSKETGLSVRQVRTALNHLFLTGELTSTTFSKFRIVTVSNYEQYQNIDKQTDKQLTSKRQASDKQVTTIEEVKNIRTKELKNNNNPPLSPLGDNPEEKQKSKSLTPKDIQNEINKFIDESELSQEVKDKLKEFVEYRRHLKCKFFTSPDYFKSGNLKDAIKCEQEYGSYATIRCIENTFTQGYQGVFFDKAWKYAKESKQTSFTLDDIMQELDKKEGE